MTRLILWNGGSTTERMIELRRLKIKEAAGIAGCKESRVYGAIREGRLTAAKEFGKVWIEREDLADWMKRYPPKTSV